MLKFRRLITFQANYGLDTTSVVLRFTAVLVSKMIRMSPQVQSAFWIAYYKHSLSDVRLLHNNA